MNNHNKELYPDQYTYPALFLEHPTLVAEPFGETEYRCGACRLHMESHEIKVRDECPFCEAHDLHLDYLGAIDVIANEIGEKSRVYRILLRKSEAAEFFGQLNRTLRESFAVGLVAASGCYEDVQEAIEKP